MKTEENGITELVERTTVYPLTEDGSRFSGVRLPVSVTTALRTLKNTGIIQSFGYRNGDLYVNLLTKKAECEVCVERDQTVEMMRDVREAIDGGAGFDEIFEKAEPDEPAPAVELGPHCAYPGHATRRACPTKRYTVIAPEDKLGRARTFEVCADAVEFARNRGYEVLGSPESVA